jgi:hypothetical protein
MRYCSGRSWLVVVPVRPDENGRFCFVRWRREEREKERGLATNIF